MFTSELANMLMPEKESGKFSTSKELQDSIKKRNELINQGKLMRDWVLKNSKEVKNNVNPFLVQHQPV